MHPPDLSRRRFLLLSSAGLVTLMAGKAAAAQTPRLLESDPAAQVMQYRERGDKVDGPPAPGHRYGQTCANCMLYHRQKAEAGYGLCDLFAGKRVSARGWCKAWAAVPKA